MSEFPSNDTAEKQILGSVLLKPDMLDELLLIVEPADFYQQANARTFRHLVAMSNARQPINETILVERIKAAGDEREIGGNDGIAVYLFDVLDSVGTVADAVPLAKVVKRHSQRRQLIAAAESAIVAAERQQADPAELCQGLESELRTIADGTPGGSITSTADAAAEFRRSLDALRAGREAGVTTGLANLDNVTGGLFGSELVILAARTGVGKTVLAGQIAQHVAQRGQVVLYVTLEMGAAELLARFACSGAGVENGRLRTGITDAEYAALTAAADALPQTLWYLNRPSVTTAEIRRESRQIQQRHGLSLVVVDYLTLVRPADPRAKRYEQVGQMSRDLKRLARELKVPVLCLAQLNREAEKTKDGRPKISHLRESGDLEQDADQIWLLHRPEIHAPGERPGQAELAIDKNRGGRTGMFPLVWDRERSVYAAPTVTPDDFSGVFDERF